MDWTEMIIAVPSDYTEKAESIAHMVVPYGIYIEDYRNLEEEVKQIARIDLIEESLLKADRTRTKIHIYISPDQNPEEAVSFLKGRYEMEQIPYEIIMEHCREDDWIHNWKKYFKPIPIGEKLLIRPIWEEEYEADQRVVLHLEPGLAFGTGAHETTRLCLKLLDGIDLTSKKVLDVGCGSGILSVASLLLGAKKAVGVDIDALAVKTAKENAARNGVDDRFEAVLGNLTEKIEGTYDVVVANIVADVIIDLNTKIKRYLKKDSVYIMSGIINSRAEDVKQSLSSDFVIEREQEENGWTALLVKTKE